MRFRKYCLRKRESLHWMHVLYPIQPLLHLRFLCTSVFFVLSILILKQVTSSSTPSKSFRSLSTARLTLLTADNIHLFCRASYPFYRTANLLSSWSFITTLNRSAKSGMSMAAGIWLTGAFPKVKVAWCSEIENEVPIPVASAAWCALIFTPSLVPQSLEVNGISQISLLTPVVT